MFQSAIPTTRRKAWRLSNVRPWIAIGSAGILLASTASAQTNLEVRRTVDGAAITWAPADAAVVGYQVTVREKVGKKLIMPPLRLDTSQLRLPLPNEPGSALRPDTDYTVVIQPLPDGVPVTVDLGTFQGEPEPNGPASIMVVEGGPKDGIDQLLAEADIDATKRYSLNDKMRAQAALLHGISGWNRSFGEARIELAVAVDQELDNWKKHVTTYFERREENLKGRMRVLDRYEQMKDQRLRIRQNARMRQLKTLFDEPRYVGKPDAAMNFLLDRFSGTPIGYGLGLDEYFASHPSHTRWDLTPEMLDAIRVATKMNDGKQIEFRLSEPYPLSLDWWPPLLREPVFRGAIADLEARRDQLIGLSQGNPQLPIEAIAELEQSFLQLTQQFYSVHRLPWTGLPGAQVGELLKVEDHLAHLKHSIAQVRERGTIEALGRGQQFDPVQDGRDAATLIAWMTRNGLDFAEPRPGDEGAYFGLLSSLKELYTIFGEPLPENFEQLPRTDPPRRVELARPQ
ncbi:MAG: hypothetical protein AAGD07_03315 [Planctomycetota bacterium]